MSAKFVGPMIVCAAVCAGTELVFAQKPTPAPAIQPFLRDTTRVEVWRYFEPPPATEAFTPGDPSSQYIANRLLAGLRARHGRIDATASVQYVQFGGLPSRAIGPGALGTGAAYFDHSGDTSSHQLYLKAAVFAVRRIGGHVDFQIGRMPYTSGAERSSDVPTIEAIKRQRLDSRLIGEFEWSLYQRAFDGIRVDWTSPAYSFTTAVFQPTQGGFEEAAGVSMSRVHVGSAVFTAAPGRWIPRSEVQLFAYDYRDTRRVTARPDNTGRPASAADIHVATLGTHIVGVRHAGAGELDGMVWFAGQFGDWYGQSHRGFAVAAEAGYRWASAAWTPWIRGGVNWFSGDGNPGDAVHHTFFPMLPTVRRYAQSTLYSMANLRDVMAQTIVRPRAALSLRMDVHALALANPADGWYAGSGATQESGRIFGYSLRPSGNANRLMEIVEGSVDWRGSAHWSVNGYLGVGTRGPVVRRSFASGPATFFYVENILQF